MEKLNKLFANARTTEIDSVSVQIINEYKKNDWIVLIYSL
jgi:hypothetical protein